MKIFYATAYLRKARKLLSDEEMKKVENEIAAHPERWPVIQGTGGVRKARAARGNSGKSGGVRILYYAWTQSGELYMLDIYAKNERSDIDEADKKKLRQLILGLKGDGHG